MPAGSARRGSLNGDVPGNTEPPWRGEKALALVTDSKYGYRGADGAIAASLIHAPNFPDPDPERGAHAVRLAVAVADACAKELEELAFDINHPPVYLPVKPHAAVCGNKVELTMGGHQLYAVKITF